MASCYEYDNEASMSVAGRDFSDHFSDQLLEQDDIKLITNSYNSFETSRFLKLVYPSLFRLVVNFITHPVFFHILKQIVSKMEL